MRLCPPSQMCLNCLNGLFWLQAQVQQLELQDRVRFLPSFSDVQRAALLAACVAVVYTPEHEHFGIVPIEAMAAGGLVLSCELINKLSLMHTTVGQLGRGRGRE